MGIFGKPSNKPQAVKTDLINNIRANESVRGKIPPISLGTNRLKMFLLWAGDFLKTDHTTTQHVPGGLFGSGGGDVKNVTTTYSTAFQAGLAVGTQDHIANVWDAAGKVQAIQVTENFTVPGGGGVFHPTKPGFGGGVGVAFAQSYSQTLTDFGSAGPVTLSGTFNQPMTVGTTPGLGVYTIDPNTGAHTFSAGDAGKNLSITYTANLTVVTEIMETTIPGGLTVQVPNSTLYAADGGVQFVDATTFAQTPAIKVTSAPAAGQYTVNTTGLYTFNTADLGRIVRITWQQTDPNAVGAASTFNFSFTPGTEGQAPWSYVTAHHPDQAVGYSGLSTVQSSTIQLGSSGEMPQMTFETVGPWSVGGGNLDCNPNDVVYAYLTDHLFGIEFPAGNLEFGPTTSTRQTGTAYAFTPAANNQGGNAAAFWSANGFFISPLIENQTTVASEMSRILEAGQCASVWSEGLLKLRPYGDTSAAGNGAIYQPLTQPVVDLADSDYIVAPGSDPIKVTRAAWNGVYNRVQIQYQDRFAGYNPEIIMEDDLASVQANGLHSESPQQWDFIKSAPAAQWAANLRVKRLTNIRNAYEFTVPAVYDYLEPMDLVTLTSAELGLSKKPVRILKIEDDPMVGLHITAEDFPYGIANATLYPKQTTLSTTEAPALAEPGNSEPLILELPDQFTQYQGYTFRVYAAPDTPGHWGGADVWLSGDNVEFTQVGSITTPALMGVLNTSMALGTGDPDTQSVTIQLSSSLQLLGNSTFDFDNHNENTLLAIIDAGGTFEIVGYKNATLTGASTYSVDTFHRGLFGTTRAAHSVGAKVVKMDQGHLEISYSASQVGTTQYVKLTSFNSFGKMAQDVSVVASNAFVLTGAFPGFFDKTSGKLFTADQIDADGVTYARITPYARDSALTTRSDNYVKNGDFEQGSFNWNVFNGPAGITYLSAQAGLPRGASCVQMSSQAGTNVMIGGGELFPIDPAKTYLFECWLDIPVPLTAGCTFRPLLIEYDSNKAQLATHNGSASFFYQTIITSTTGNTWQYLTFEITGSASVPAAGQFNSNTRYVAPGLMLVASATTGQIGKALGFRFSEVAAGNKRALGAIDSGNLVVPTAIDFTRPFVNKNVDNIPDGPTFGRPLVSRLSAGKPLIDFSESIHLNKNVDNVADGSTFGRPLISRLSAGKPLIDFGENIHLNSDIVHGINAAYNAAVVSVSAGTIIGSGPTADMTDSNGGANYWTVSNSSIPASIVIDLGALYNQPTFLSFTSYFVGDNRFLPGSGTVDASHDNITYEHGVGSWSGVSAPSTVPVPISVPSGQLRYLRVNLTAIPVAPAGQINCQFGNLKLYTQNAGQVFHLDRNIKDGTSFVRTTPGEKSGAGRAATNINTDGTYATIPYHGSAFRSKTTTNVGGSTTSNTYITVGSFVLQIPSGFSQYKGTLTLTHTGLTPWTVRGRIKIGSLLSNELVLQNLGGGVTGTSSGTVTITGITGGTQITVEVQCMEDSGSSGSGSASFAQVQYTDQDTANLQ